MNLKLILIGICSVSLVLSVPILSEIPSNKLEDLDDVEVIDDDFTTRSLERLSSAATCLVAGVEYTHGQQINRIDPCEFCLCLDGEMFCWWQDCPPATDGPCKDQGPFSQCDNIVVTKSSEVEKKLATNIKNMSSNVTSITSKNKAYSSHGSNIIKNNLEKAFIPTSTERDEDSSEISSIETTITPTFCVIMGLQYRIGDKLPHDTGNCVECICGQGAKIACSPHQCAPIGEEITDYRPPEPRLTNADTF